MSEGGKKGDVMHFRVPIDDYQLYLNENQMTVKGLFAYVLRPLISKLKSDRTTPGPDEDQLSS